MSAAAAPGPQPVPEVRGPGPDLTALFSAGAPSELFNAVYAHLRAIAQAQMNQERKGHTLQATALVHEAYVKLMGAGAPFNDRARFYAAAAEAMRRILVDHARARATIRRGGNEGKAPARFSIPDVLDLAASDDSHGILALDEAVSRLEKIEPQAAAVVRLRFYAGLSVDATAEALGIGARTVDREWAFARAWLYEALKQAD